METIVVFRKYHLRTKDCGNNNFLQKDCSLEDQVSSGRSVPFIKSPCNRLQPQATSALDAEAEGAVQARESVGISWV